MTQTAVGCTLRAPRAGRRVCEMEKQTSLRIILVSLAFASATLLVAPASHEDGVHAQGRAGQDGGRGRAGFAVTDPPP